MQLLPEAAAIVRRAKITLAICVAEEIYQRASRISDLEKKEKAVRIAADALDKTAPDPALLEACRSKPEHLTNADFLLANVGAIELLDEDRWPPHKVPPKDRKEYRRVMSGLEAYLKQAFVKKTVSRADQADILEALRFIAPQVARLQDPLVQRLLSGQF